MAPARKCGAISRAAAPHWPTGMQTMTRSAPSTAAALVLTTWSAMPSSMTRRRVAADRAVATMLPARFCARAARAIDDPIRPTPIRARRSNTEAVIAGSGLAVRISLRRSSRGRAGWGPVLRFFAVERTPPGRASRGHPPRRRGGKTSARPLFRSRPSSRSYRGWSCHEFRERCHRKPICFLAPDAHAQGIWQPIGADLT